MKSRMKKTLLLMSALVAGSFAQNMDSREGDSLALVAIKNANPEGGYLVQTHINMIERFWWDLSQPIHTWTGVNVYNGRVVALNFVRSTRCKGFVGIKTIPSEINNLTKVTTLEFPGIGITTVPETLSGLKSIDTLSMSNNPLLSFPNAVLGLTSLQYLNLDCNGIKELPKEIGQLSSLKFFSVARNQLQSLPAEIGLLKNLEALGIHTNPLETLPDEICSLKNVASLIIYDDMYKNGVYDSTGSFKTLPKGIGGMAGLKTLEISCPMLQSLPEEIGNLENLEVLSIVGGSITTVPDEIGNLENLERLSISGCKITELPDSLGKLKKLKSLSVNHTKLAHIPEMIFDIDSLVGINLDSNVLNDVPGAILKYNGNIQLSGNLLKRSTLPDSIVYWLDDHVGGQWWATETSIENGVPIAHKQTPLSLSYTGTAIQLSEMLPSLTTMKVFTMNGRVVASGVVVGDKIEIGALAKGLYIVQIKSLNSLYSVKLHIQ